MSSTPRPLGDLARARFEILRAVVDEVIDAERPELRVLTGGSRSDHLGAEVLGDLRRGDADAAARRMHENGLVALEAAHDHDKLPGGEVVDGNGGALQGRHACRAREHLIYGDADRVRIAAEARHGDDVASGPVALDARADGVDPAAHLVAGHDRNRRQVGIEAHAAENVGEVDPARLDPDADLAGLRFGIGRFLDGKTSGAPVRVIQICRMGIAFRLGAQARIASSAARIIHLREPAGALLLLHSAHADLGALC